ncbi:MAG: RNA polymerase sigma factor [Bacteroidota bacterium]
MKGETHAFSPLVERYKHMVFTLALRVVKNTEEAEEVAQDSFVKAYRGLSKFKGDSKFSTWLYRIAYYSALDAVKKIKRIPETELVDGYLGHAPQVVQNTLEDMVNEERSFRIRRAMQKLPSDYASLLTLHYFEELSLKEISEIMGSSPDTLKVKLFRARKRLGGILETQQKEKLAKS